MAHNGSVILFTILFVFLSSTKLNEATDATQRVARWFGRNSKLSGEVKFNLHTKGSTIDTPETSESADKIMFTKLQLQKPIKIIIHGWKGHGKSKLNREVVNAYLAHSDVNIIVVDWLALGSKSMNYYSVRHKVPIVAGVVAKFIDNLHKQRRVNLNNIHIIGHSLGAHIAGIAGYQVTTGKIGRITGLDPAKPLFSLDKPRERLSTDSAKFVDVIHSSSNLEGFGAPIGHSDFYPNGPHMYQPGCGADIAGVCSHRRAYHFFAESISNPKGFPAVPCADWSHFQKRDCDSKRLVLMGEPTPATATGSYFLATNKNAPFARNTLWQ